MFEAFWDYHTKPKYDILGSPIKEFLRKKLVHFPKQTV